MMPDLGKYAVEVSLAYGGSFVLIFGLLVVSLVQSRRARRLLDDAERRQSDG